MQWVYEEFEEGNFDWRFPLFQLIEVQSSERVHTGLQDLQQHTSTFLNSHKQICENYWWASNMGSAEQPDIPTITQLIRPLEEKKVDNSINKYLTVSTFVSAQLFFGSVLP